MKTSSAFSPKILDIDVENVASHIEESIRRTVFHRLRRWGAVVGLSGGIDSSVTAALCVRALGKSRVFGLMMPEEESSSDSLKMAGMLAENLGFASMVGNIGPTLKTLGCYERRDEAIRKVSRNMGKAGKARSSFPI